MVVGCGGGGRTNLLINYYSPLSGVQCPEGPSPEEVGPVQGEETAAEQWTPSDALEDQEDATGEKVSTDARTKEQIPTVRIHPEDSGGQARL